MNNLYGGYLYRSHTILGRVTLADGMEDVAMSLEETPVFFNAKEGTYYIDCYTAEK